MKCPIVLALGAGLLFSIGCTQHLGNFTFLSTKNLDLSNLDMEASANAPIVEGQDNKPIIFIFPTGTPSLKEAVDRAIESGRGKALSDARITHTFWYVPYIVGNEEFKVRGKVVH